MERTDVLVVGAGIVGLAAAWQLQRRQPDLRVAVADKESVVGLHQSSHNSGVVHAGIYYTPGSLKARLCVEGKQQLERFAADKGIELIRNGKLVVATSPRELNGLRELTDRAARNGVAGLAVLDASELRTVEPTVRGIAALHSPTTGVIDFGDVCRALAEDVARDGELWLDTRIGPIEQHTSGAVVESEGRGEIRARAVLSCAGLQADRVVLASGPDALRVVPFRGTWYRLREPIASEVRGNIYPVPDPRYPFLGVHLTRRVDGEVLAGPNAFLSLARERYSRWAFDPQDALDIGRFPGFWRFAVRNLPAAGREFLHEASRTAYAAAVAQYMPDVTADDLERGPMGIRAQAMTASGKLVDEFTVDQDRRVIAMRNAPSPAATASLAIGDLLADRVLAVLDG